MKIVSGSIIRLRIPFVETFRHHLAARSFSDSIVVKLKTDSGLVGYGEGVPRSYVTGETQAACLQHIQSKLLPTVMQKEFPAFAATHLVAEVGRLISDESDADAVVWHAARCAVELALLDVCLKVGSNSLREALPPADHDVFYTAVIGSGSLASVTAMAKRCKAAGFRSVKMKITSMDALESVAAVRNILGPDVSFRLDANGAFDAEGAAALLDGLAPYDIQCVEQPIPRGDVAALATLQASSPVPIMADESLVTEADALELIRAQGVDYFNLRISKCGGIGRTLAIAKLAREAGIRVVLGCQVGETSILSAAGCHVASHLAEVRAVEGAYGTHLLVEDVADPPIMFSDGGLAPALTGIGLGCNVREDKLRHYAEEWIDV